MRTIVGARTAASRLACVFALMPAMLALDASLALAQTPEPPPAAPKHRAPPRKKEPPAPAPQAAPAPAAPQAPVQQPVAAPPQPPMPPVVYSPWTKICPKPPPNAPQIKQVCLTVKEVRLETGQFLAGAALIQQEGEDKKLLRITLPLGMQLPQGTRVTLDSEQPLSGPFVTCIPNGCMADYQIDTAFVGKLKVGQQLLLQAVNMQGQVASFVLPLAELGKAVDGAPTDPEEFEKRQKAEWEKRLKDHPPPNAPGAAEVASLILVRGGACASSLSRSPGQDVQLSRVSRWR